ncbi:MAG: type II toxin-antitoxin system Phd/YefM family antitoxin [Bacillota bacterium]|nr:type II toxin-antitoxin system Phd/YefM family antitoxin [Bacillota bacterium]
MMNQKLSTSNIMDSLVSISRFNKGEAKKVFDEVNEAGQKIVLKNNKPISVLMSPSRYEEIMEALEDYVLYFEAEKRLASANNQYIPSNEILNELGIDESDLDDIEVEIE